MTGSNGEARWPLGWACPSPDDLALAELCTLLDAVADAGYAGIEPMIAAPYRTDARVLERALEERGLRLIGMRTGGLVVQHGHMLSDPEPTRRRRSVAALCEVVRFASRFGRPKILVGLMQGRLQEGVSLCDAEKWIVEGLAEAAHVAAPLGIEIDLEPINRYLLGYHATVDSVLQVIARTGAANIRLLADCYHMHLEEATIGAALVQAGSAIGHVHVADSNRHAPGGGHLAFPEMFGVLRAVGYRGDITVECDYWPDQLAALYASARYLAQWCGREPRR